MHTEPKRKGSLVSLQDGTLTEADARLMLEEMRFPNGLHCIFKDCGGAEVWRLKVKSSERKDGRYVGPRELFKCKACRRQFSVTKGTIFEDSKIPLRTWMQVMFRMCSSKKSVSAHQIHREFGISYDAAWFMCHRVRHAMTEKDPARLRGVIEADETYVGGKPRGTREQRARIRGKGQGPSYRNKTPVFGIKEREGRVRAMAMPDASQRKIQQALFDNIAASESRLMTDEHQFYYGIKAILPHGVIRHSSEYVRGEVHTQGIESFWALLKRGLIGTYHHVDAGYLNQYVQEFAFRANHRKVSDYDRFRALVGNVEGRVDWYLGKKSAFAVAEASE